jgi:spermidine/putrescine transport system ATP-binding protein
MSDRIAVMSKGKLQQIGPVLDVYERPQNVFVAEFLGLSNIWPITTFEGNIAQTPLGALELFEPYRPGGMAMIRPEKIWIYNDTAAPKDGRPNLFFGAVREAIYMGAATQYRVELDGGQTVLAYDTNNQAAERSWRPGEKVAVELKPENIMLVQP